MSEPRPQNLRTAREISRPRRALLRRPRARIAAASSSPAPTARSTRSTPRQTSSPDRAAGRARPLRHRASGSSGDTVVSGGYDGRLIWWDLRDGRVIRTIDGAHALDSHAGGVAGRHEARQRRRRHGLPALGRRDRRRGCHELRGHAEQTPHALRARCSTACTFSADGRHLATGDRVGHVVVWDVGDRPAARRRSRRRSSTPGTASSASARSAASAPLAFSPDGRHLAVGGVGQIGNIDGLQGPSRVEVFDWERAPARPRVHRHQGHRQPPRLPSPTAAGCAPSAAAATASSLFHDPERRQVDPPGQRPDARPRRRLQRRPDDALRRRPPQGGGAGAEGVIPGAFASRFGLPIILPVPSTVAVGRVERR